MVTLVNVRVAETGYGYPMDPTVNTVTNITVHIVRQRGNMNVKPLDNNATLRLWRCLRNRQRLRARALGRALLLAGLLLISLLSDTASALDKKELQMRYRMYALGQIKDWHEFSCLNALWNRESNWNPNAVNGSHYGIPQGRSAWLRNATPRKQIDWGIKYIQQRYTTPCVALNHWKRYGWH